MATNITTDNLQTADTLESLGAGTENGSFLICGKGSKLYQLPYERLKKNVGGSVVIPTGKPSSLAIGEMWIESVLESQTEKLFNDFSILVDFSKVGSYAFNNNVLYFLDYNGVPYSYDFTNTSLTKISETNGYSAIICYSDFVIFFHTHDMGITFGIDIATNEKITAPTTAESMSFSGMTVYQIVSNNYPYDAYNGIVLFDNESTYSLFVFSKNGTEWAISNEKSINFSEIETTTGEKQKNVYFYPLFISSIFESIQVFSTNLNILCCDTESLTVDDEETPIEIEEIKSIFWLIDVITTDPEYTYEYELAIITNKDVKIINLSTREIKTYSLFENNNVTSTIVDVKPLSSTCFFALQKTINYQYSIVKYEIEKNYSYEVSFVSEIERELKTNIFNVQGFYIDPTQMKNYLDGLIIEPPIVLVGQGDYGGVAGSAFENVYSQSVKINLSNGVKTLLTE